MRRLTILLVLGSFAAVGGTAFAASPQQSPSPPTPHTYRIVIKTSGDEYEQKALALEPAINGSDGTRCPPSLDVPSVKAKCFKWSAKHLGHGTYTQADVNFVPGRPITWTFTFTDSHGDTLTGNGLVPGVFPDGTPRYAIGHTIFFAGEIDTFTGGTGRFAGVTGILTGQRTHVVGAVDPATGIVRTKVTSKVVGTLTVLSKL